MIVVNNIDVGLVSFSVYVTGFDRNRVWTRAAWRRESEGKRSAAGLDAQNRSRSPGSHFSVRASFRMFRTAMFR